MKTFGLPREYNETGISGTGCGAVGVGCDSGPVVLRCIVGEHRSTVVWPSIEAVEAIHGHGGRTRIVWTDDEIDATPCDSEKHSWDYYRPGQVDSYWMRCHLVGPHDEHENSETGATWREPEPGGSR